MPRLLYSVPLTPQQSLSTYASSGDSRTLTASLAQFLVGSLLLSPGSWCTQDFVCALQGCFSPVLWKFCNEIPLAFKVKFPVGPWSLCRIPGLGNLLWALEFCNSAIPSLLQLFSSLWVVCSVALCGVHTLHLPGLLQPEPLSLWQATAGLCLCRRHLNTQRQVWLSLCGVPGSWCTQGLV